MTTPSIAVELAFSAVLPGWQQGIYLQPLGVTNSDGSMPAVSNIVGVAKATIAANTGTNVNPVTGQPVSWPVGNYPYILTIRAIGLGSGTVTVYSGGAAAINFPVTVNSASPQVVTANASLGITVPASAPAG